MPFGDVFSKLEFLKATTADEKKIVIENNAITRLGFKILGLPHIGMRLRANKISSNFPKGRVKKMVDGGCGTGVYSFSFFGKADQINAVDISEEKVNSAQKVNIFNNISFKKVSLCKLPFEDGNFDVIICSDVLEHIKEDKKAFGELVRTLKKGGTLLITVPYDSNWNKKVYKDYGHERTGYTAEDFNKLSKKHRLEVVKWEGYSYPIADYLSNLSYKLISNKILLGMEFYPFLGFLSLQIARLDPENPMDCLLR